MLINYIIFFQSSSNYVWNHKFINFCSFLLNASIKLFLQRFWQASKLLFSIVQKGLCQVIHAFLINKAIFFFCTHPLSFVRFFHTWLFFVIVINFRKSIQLFFHYFFYKMDLYFNLNENWSDSELRACK